jgi:SAM-dependent methyltransferase
MAGQEDRLGTLSPWERLGDAYDREWQPPAKRALSAKELAFVVRQIERTPARTALDVGTGGGRILAGLLRRTTSTELYGVDIAQAMVDACERRFAGQERVRGLYVCDISREDIPVDQRFDLICAVRVLKYIANWPETVGKLASALEKGGMLVFTMENERSLTRYTRRLAWLKRPDPTFQQRGRWTVPGYAASQAELEDLCRDLGLTVVEISGFTKLPYFVYNRPTRPRLAELVVKLDRALDRIVGEAASARELFVAAQAADTDRGASAPLAA